MKCQSLCWSNFSSLFLHVLPLQRLTWHTFSHSPLARYSFHYHLNHIIIIISFVNFLNILSLHRCYSILCLRWSKESENKLNWSLMDSSLLLLLFLLYFVQDFIRSLCNDSSRILIKDPLCGWIFHTAPNTFSSVVSSLTKEMVTNFHLNTPEMKNFDVTILMSDNCRWVHCYRRGFLSVLLKTKSVKQQKFPP